MPSPQIAQTSTEPACSSASWQVHLVKTLFSKKIRSKLQPLFHTNTVVKLQHVLPAQGRHAAALQALFVSLSCRQPHSPASESKDFLPSVKTTAHITSQDGGLEYLTVCRVQPVLELPLTPGTPDSPRALHKAQGYGQQNCPI